MIKTLIPKNISVVGAASKDPIKDLLEKSFDRYNKVREGIMACFKQYNIAPIIMYRMACELDFIAMSEYQQYLIDYCDTLINEEKTTKAIKWDNWGKIFENHETKVVDCWKKIVDILRIEDIKVLEIARIAPEIRTTSQENFINALGNFVEDKLKKDK